MEKENKHGEPEDQLDNANEEKVQTILKSLEYSTRSSMFAFEMAFRAVLRAKNSPPLLPSLMAFTSWAMVVECCTNTSLLLYMSTTILPEESGSLNIYEEESNDLDVNRKLETTTQDPLTFVIAVITFTMESTSCWLSMLLLTICMTFVIEL